MDKEVNHNPPLEPTAPPITPEVQQKQINTIVREELVHEPIKQKPNFAEMASTNNGAWRFQKNKTRHHNPNNIRLQLRGGGRASDCPIKGAPEPLRYIFLSRIVGDTDESNLKSYLKQKNIVVKVIEQMSHPESKFKAFKIAVPRSNYHAMFSVDLWGDGVNVNKFRGKVDTK